MLKILIKFIFQVSHANFFFGFFSSFDKFRPLIYNCLMVTYCAFRWSKKVVQAASFCEAQLCVSVMNCIQFLPVSSGG